MQNPVIFVTRKAHFNAAHKLYNNKWTREENETLFGKCANHFWHGHNFDLYVTIKGRPDNDTGFVMDLKKLKILIEDEVVVHLDHKNLNTDVPFLNNVMPSVENIAIAIWNRLLPHFPETIKLHKILLYETERNFVEYFGPDTPF
ncbi:MAG: 6-carboxytetrahydropterin synthase [Bacteroidetes bacterium]|nr:6-carboxytetrahydropterin synthase [Bacteroidota bacterium]